MGAIVFLIVAVFAIAVMIGVVGLVAGLLGLAIKLIPVVVIGYIVVKVIQRLERPGGTAVTRSSRDSSWLDTRD
jgi:hypothetical protein